MTTDPIIAEIHRQRAEEMERYGFDFEAFCRDLKEQEKLSERLVLAPLTASPRVATQRYRRSQR